MSNDAASPLGILPNELNLPIVTQSRSLSTFKKVSQNFHQLVYDILLRECEELPPLAHRQHTWQRINSMDISPILKFMRFANNILHVAKNLNIEVPKKKIDTVLVALPSLVQMINEAELIENLHASETIYTKITEEESPLTLSEIWEELALLTSPQELCLAREGIKSLPDQISTFNELQNLNLSFNKLNTLPSTLQLCTTLQSLNLSGNQFYEIPPWLNQLTQLTELYLNQNPLKHLPSLVNLTSLSVLGVSKTYLDQWPQLPSSVARIYFKDSQLGTLPDSIGQLTNLQRLDLKNNFLETIPSTIDQLTKLTYLNLSDNLLVSLPSELANLRLREIHLKGNYDLKSAT